MRAFVALALALGSALTATNQTAAPASKNGGDLVSSASRQPAPDFTLIDVQGHTITLSKYKGKVVLLDFWATTCGGCKVELPWYVGFDRQYRDKGLVVLGLDMYGESPEVIRKFMGQWNMHYPVAVGTDEIGDRFGLKEMPLTLLIDRNGKIAVSHTGIVDREIFDADIKALL